MNNPARRQPATLWGFSAIILWGMLALLTSFCASIPPFQLTATTFCIAFLIGLAAFIKSGADFSAFRQPAAVWLNGVLGLFGYHALYFMAMRHAPAIEASLINYLWPVLIVLFACFLPGEKLRWFHLGGVMLGFAGVAALLLKAGAFSLEPRYLFGYGCALACAVIWSAYSVLSRKNRHVSTLMIAPCCGITALLSLICHLLFEQTVLPAATTWLPMALLGLGPVGLAFFAWDYGVKNGNIKLLGTLSYFAPLLSSALLVCFGRTAFSWNLLAACALIIGGSVVSTLDNFRPKRSLKTCCQIPAEQNSPDVARGNGSSDK